MKPPQITLDKTAVDHSSLTSDDRVSYSPYLSLESNISDLPFPKQTCRILSEDDIRHRIDDQIAQISALLCLSKPQASLLLCFFNFSVAKTLDSWFSDEPQLRRKLGLLQYPLSISAADFTCGICFDSFSADMISYANCGHPFCNDCWNNYISTSISNDGFRCLVLRCPEPTCPVSIGPEMVGKLVYRNDWVKYSKCLVKSYVESHKNIKWCPSPDCVYAIEIEDYLGFSVTCRCFTSICWNCELENHRPVDCETVKKWMEKNRLESENVNYILAYCKPCPKCRRPIEKNEGCMHMVCKICLHSFCWLCLSPYSKHPKCNGYIFNNEAEKKEMAKNSLEKYTFHFERWDANRKSKLEALRHFKLVKGTTFKKLSEARGVPEGDLDFISKAWLQVVECRRVLEWSYAYGYFMAENEDAKRQFFEYLQGEAESCLEKLHKCVESSDQIAGDFLGFRAMLVGLTVVTGDYFEKLVRALENGLADVVSGGNGVSSSRERPLENGLVDVVSGRDGASSSRERALENGLVDVVSGGDGASSSRERALENGLVDVVSGGDGASSSRERALENWLADVVSGGDGASSSRTLEFEDFWLCDRCGIANPVFLAECEMCMLEEGEIEL